MAEALASLGVAGKPAVVIFLLLRCSSTHSASVIAVGQIAQDIVSKCSAYRVAYKDASKDMSRLSDQVSGLRGALLDLNKLIVAEEAQTFARLPTLMTALDISQDDQTPGESPAVTKTEDEARSGYGLTETMPTEHARLLKRLLNKLKRNERKHKTDPRQRAEGIPFPTATTSGSLPAGAGNTAGNAPESKNDHMNLPRVLRDCHAELQSLLGKLETKNVRASPKEALIYAFKQGEVNKTLDNLQRFQQQLVVALSIDQAYVQLPSSTANDPLSC
jgi:hypothetical protein